MNALIVPVSVLVAALLGTAVGEVVSEEIRGRLDKIPNAVLRLAARRLPAAMRADLLDE